MTVFTKRAIDVFAPTTAGGQLRGADMAESAVWGTEVERGMNGAAAGRIDQVTWSGLSAIAGTRVGQPAIVYGPDAGTHTDPVTGATVPNVGEYYWSVSPAGWRRAGSLQRTLVHALNTGAGTANAIQATSDVQFSQTPYAALITVNLVATNTGAMTLSINGDVPRPLVTNTGTAIPANYVRANMSALVQIDADGKFRLFSYGDATAIQAAAESAATRAETAASHVETVIAALSPGGTGHDMFEAPTPYVGRDVLGVNSLDYSWIKSLPDGVGAAVGDMKVRDALERFAMPEMWSSGTVTDWRLPIQKMLDNHGGRICLLSPKQYYTSRSLVLKSDTSMMGTRGTALRPLAASGFTGALLTTWTGAIQRKFNVSLQGFMLYGNPSSPSDWAMGLETRDLTDAYIANLVISGFAQGWQQYGSSQASGGASYYIRDYDVVITSCVIGRYVDGLSNSHTSHGMRFNDIGNQALVLANGNANTFTGFDAEAYVIGVLINGPANDCLIQPKRLETTKASSIGISRVAGSGAENIRVNEPYYSGGVQTPIFDPDERLIVNGWHYKNAAIASGTHTIAANSVKQITIPVPGVTRVNSLAICPRDYNTAGNIAGPEVVCGDGDIYLYYRNLSAAPDTLHGHIAPIRWQNKDGM